MPGILDFIESQKKKAAVKAAFAQSGYQLPGTNAATSPGAPVSRLSTAQALPDTDRLASSFSSSKDIRAGVSGQRGARDAFAGLGAQGVPGSSIPANTSTPGLRPTGLLPGQPGQGAQAAPGLPGGLGDGFAQPGQDFASRQNALVQQARDQFGDAGDPKTLWKVGMYLGNQGYVDAAAKFLNPIQKAALEREQTASQFGLNTTAQAQQDQAANQRNAENLRFKYGQLAEQKRQFNIGQSNLEASALQSGLQPDELRQPNLQEFEVVQGLRVDLDNAEVVNNWVQNLSSTNRGVERGERDAMAIRWKLAVQPYFTEKLKLGTLQDAEREVIERIMGDPTDYLNFTSSQRKTFATVIASMQQTLDNKLIAYESQGISTTNIDYARLDTGNNQVDISEIEDAREFFPEVERGGSGEAAFDTPDGVRGGFVNR